MSVIQRIILFIVFSYSLAFLIDYIAYLSGLSLHVPETTSNVATFLWGLARMWSVALSVVFCLLFFRTSVRGWFKDVLTFSRKALLYYLVSPLIIYFALGVYIMIATFLKLFDFNNYVRLIAESLRNVIHTSSEAELERLSWFIALLQIPLAYVAGISINTLYALGEELGWRGYMYKQLGWKPSAKNVIIIGVAWNLWHISTYLLNPYIKMFNMIQIVCSLTLSLTQMLVFTYILLVFTSITDSILPAASLHGTFNALWNLTIATSAGPIDQVENLLIIQLISVISWILIVIILMIITRIFHKMR